LQRLLFQKGRVWNLFDDNAFRHWHTVWVESVFLEDALTFSGKEIEHLQAFDLRAITQRVKGRAADFLVAATIEYLDGLPVTTLRGPVNQCDLFKSAGWIPLPTLALGKHPDAFKKGLVVFAFHVVGLEGEPPNLPIHLIKVWMFFNTAAGSR
jgi:hypothetical protein